MNTETLQCGTFRPEGHTAQLAEVGEFLLRQTSDGQLDAMGYALVRATDGREQVAVPAELHRARWRRCFAPRTTHA